MLRETASGSGDAERPTDSEPGSRLPLIILAVALAACGVMLLAFTSRVFFVTDEWNLLLLRPGWGLDQFFNPFHEHTIMAPALIYKILQSVFGMDSALPMHVTAIATFLLAAGLFFVYVRRRTGDWAALIMTVLILFLGGAFEDFLWAFQVGYFGSLAAGLGALIMLDRDDRRGDLWAAILLVVSLSFSSLGIPFIAAAIVEWLLNPRDRRRRVFVPGIAVAFYVTWWLGWGRQAESDFSLSNIADLPAYVFTAVSAGFTTIAGLATGDGSEPDQPHLIWGKIFLVVALILAGWRFVRRRTVSRSLLVVLVLGLSFYLLAGLNQSDLRPPTSSRYQLPSAIFILLIAAELLEGVRIRLPALLVAATLGAVAVLGGVKLMHQQLDARWIPTSESVRSSLGAIDLAGQDTRSDYVLELGLEEPVPVASYLKATGKFGNAGYPESELEGLRPDLRLSADTVLVDTLGIGLVGEVPPLAGLKCQSLSRWITVAPGQSVVIENRGSIDLGVGLSRFSDEPGVEVGAVLPNSLASLNLPADRSGRPWRVGVTRGQSGRLCADG